MICPVWQYPHCGTSSAIHACCNTCSPLAPSPSMVVMLFPATCETGVEHDRIADPSTCTVQAPHSPAPQPNFVPVSSRVSRNTQSKGVSGETLTFFSLPLTRSVKSAICFPVSIATWTIILLNRPEKWNGRPARARDQLKFPVLVPIKDRDRDPRKPAKGGGSDAISFFS